MGVTDRFYRQGRDIVNQYWAIYEESPKDAKIYLDEQFNNVRGMVKKHVLYKISMDVEHD